MDTVWLYRDGHLVVQRNENELVTWEIPPDRGPEFAQALNAFSSMSSNLLSMLPTAYLLDMKKE